MLRLSLFLVSLSIFSSAVFAQIDTPKQLIVFKYVDQMPEFNGNLSEYLRDNIVFPPEALKQDIEGRVILRFIVKETGELDSIKVLESWDPLFNAEAIRLIADMPRWKPGRKNGRKVNVYYMLPVFFRLPEE